MMGPVNWSSPVNWNDSLNHGLVSWWLNVPHWRGGTTWRDLTTFRHGTLTGMDPSTDWVGTRDRPGGLTALEFDGSDDNVNLTLDAKLSIGFTFSAWAWTSTVDAVLGGIATSEVNVGYTNYWVFFGRDGADAQLALFDGSNNPKALASSAITIKTWFHLVGVRDFFSDRLLLYMDGVLVAGPTIDSTTSIPTYGDFNIGGQVNVASRRWTGLIDDVRVYDRSLDAHEVLKLYQDSRVGYPRTLRRLKRRGVAVPVAPPDAGRAKFLPLLGVA